MSSPLVNTHRLPAGTILEDRYEITGFLGSGGFAQVYRGRQLTIDRPVAIKILQARDGIDDQDAFEERFLREAQTAAQIRHSNVVTIYDYGVTGHQPYIVMELLEGHDLNAELKRGEPLSAHRALRLFIDCLDALGDGHKQGIVHKDLKPANLYINDPGTRREALKILDFGIARLGQKSHLTSTGQLMGTPKYYAPEYIKTQTVSPALDVYQMGLILVESFTRRPVVDVDDPYVCLMYHSTGNLEIPESLMRGPLGPVIVKALALEHTERYADAHEFRDALEGIDPDSVSPVPSSDPLCRLADISGSLQANIIPPGTGSHTGPHARRAHHTGGLARPPSGDLKTSGARVSAGARMRSSSTSQSQPLHPDAPKKTSRGLWIGLGVTGIALLLLLLAGGSLTAWFVSQDQEVEAPAAKAQAPSQKADTKRAEEEILMPDFDIDKARPVAVKIEVEPSGASIFIGERKLGAAPLSHTFEADTSDPVMLLITAPGYAPRTHKLAPADQPSVKIALTRDPNARKPERTSQKDPRKEIARVPGEGVSDKPPPANTGKVDKKPEGGGGLMMPPPE